MSADELAAQTKRVDAILANRREVDAASCEIDGKEAEGDHAEVVLVRRGCSDYFIADGPRGLYLLQRFGGHWPVEGDIIVGKINSYGFADVCYPGRGEGRVYVDDYLLGKSRAAEKYADKCN